MNRVQINHCNSKFILQLLRAAGYDASAMANAQRNDIL